MPRSRRFVLAGGVLLATSRPARAGYDPLLAQASAAGILHDLVVQDAGRKRDIPVLIRLPPGRARVPVVLFSHGLGGARTNSPYLARHWVARGYATVFLQHDGSDEAVWRDQPPAQRMAAMRRAASLDNLLLRMRDVVAVLDVLAVWNRAATHPLRDRLDLAHIGMSGHSFGAVTTQAVSGQAVPRMVRGTWPDPRIRAALPMSPSAPRRGSAADAFKGVAVPWLLMSGTNDIAVVGDADAANRLSVFPALPPGAKYELVLDGGEHSAFSDRPLPGDRLARNPNHHRAILALSTAFWDAFLNGDAVARTWLDGDGPRTVLEPADRWQRK